MNILLERFHTMWLTFLTSLIALLLGACLFIPACTTTLTGAGGIEFGVSNDNFVFIRHTVDGDKASEKAKSELDVDPVLKSLIGSGPKPEPDPE